MHVCLQKGQAFDVTAMKKLALGLERKFTANQEMRIKHANEPLKSVKPHLFPRCAALHTNK